MYRVPVYYALYMTTIRYLSKNADYATVSLSRRFYESSSIVAESMWTIRYVYNMPAGEDDTPTADITLLYTYLCNDKPNNMATILPINDGSWLLKNLRESSRAVLVVRWGTRLGNRP